MKTKTTNSVISTIKTAVEDLQNLSYTEFQHLLPAYFEKDRKPGYTTLDRFFYNETGVSVKDYFNQVKVDRANELLNHYRLSPLEAAYQLGFKTAPSLKKALNSRNRHLHSMIRYAGFQRKMTGVSEYMR